MAEQMVLMPGTYLTVKQKDGIDALVRDGQYSSRAKAIRAAVNRLLGVDDETLSQSAHGDQLKESRQKDHLCPRGIPCEETGIEA